MKHHQQPQAERNGLHPFARNVLFGTVQLTLIVYALAVVVWRTAPLSPQYFRSIACYAALAEVAPVILAAGVIAALVSDLALRSRGGDASHKG